MRVLVIGDLHEPVSHPAYLKFCKDIYKKYTCNAVIFIGDIADWHAVSRYVKEPSCPGPKDEYKLAREKIQKWYKAFPKAKVCIGNHDERPERLAKTVSIPPDLMKSYNDMWGTPGWIWDWDFTIDNVYYLHGTDTGGIHPAWNNMTKNLMSTVMGHCHARAGYNWKTTPAKRIFAMDVGCVDAETEYLTPTGWKQIGSYTDDLVGQYTTDGLLQFVKPLDYIDIPADTLNHFETKYGVSQTICNNHNIVYLSQTGILTKKIASKVIEQHRRDSNGFRGRFITTFIPDLPGCNWTDAQLRLQVAFLADGTISKDKYQYTRIALRKIRKQKCLRLLLKETNTKYKESIYDNGDISFYFKPPVITKSIPKDWYQATTEQLRIIADESLLWDGNQKNIFDSMDKSVIDFIQYAFAGSGRRASIIPGHFTQRVCVSQGTTTVGIAGSTKVKITKVKTVDGRKYCFSVPSKMLILRKDGCIFITGNCGIDVKAWQFVYGRHCKDRPILSCGVVINGTPYHEIMKMGRGETYDNKKFEE